MPILPCTDITVLDGPTAVRKRPGMYLGPPTKENVLRLMQRALHEFVAASSGVSEVSVSTRKNGVWTFECDGEGWDLTPGRRVSIPPSRDITPAELLMTTGHVVYPHPDHPEMPAVSLFILNSLSMFAVVRVQRDGREWTQSFLEGFPLTGFTEGRRVNTSGVHGLFFLNASFIQNPIVNPSKMRSWAKKTIPHVDFRIG